MPTKQPFISKNSQNPREFFAGVFDLFKTIGISVFILGISGCATLPSIVISRSAVAEDIAQNASMAKSTVQTSHFLLTSYDRIKAPGKPLTVYIEGDGLAWLSRSVLSTDPTPMKPMMLRLASMDTAENIVYLARPCQYSDDPSCNSSYWSNKRFSEEVVSSMNEAVDHFRQRSNAKEIHLIGYSGGAAVAALIAARRQDIASLRTIAGNLDPNTLTHFHHSSPLNGSLDPMTEAPKLSQIPQRHFVGLDDKVVPPLIARNYLNKSGNSRCVKVVELKGVAHDTGWVERWRELLEMPMNCAEESASVS